MKNNSVDWPDDVDGDVLRRMEEAGFDFSAPVDIDFNIDFESWPPPAQFMEKLIAIYPKARLIEPEDDDDDEGYVEIVVHDLLTYDLVIRLQRELSELAAPYGGVCESWGAWS